LSVHFDSCAAEANSGKIVAVDTTPLTLMAVHAHPDDEAVSTGGILHKYSGMGVRTVLVTCTGGEFGDGDGGVKPGQPGHEPEAVKRIRRLELEASCRQLRVSHLELLGYHDSGMVEWDRAGTPGSFAGSALSEEVDRLSRLIERYRPEVVVTYAEDGGYGHPDHIRTHEVTRGAVLATGIPNKLYYTVFPKSLAARVLRQMKQMGIDPWEVGELDFDPDDPPFGVADDLITSTIDVTEDVTAKLAAVRAHSSQMDNAFFANLPSRVAPLILGHEHYIRSIDSTGATLPESDLFARLS
jgi:LmbE family N-acetylglucosaminyl deacetylase